MKKTQNKCLLFTGLIFLLIGILSLFVASTPPATKNFSNIYIAIITIVIIAPIFEEIAFRGMFTSNKILKAMSFVGIPLSILLTQNYYAFILYFIYLLIYFIPKSPSWLIYGFNAVLFGVIHYSLEDFSENWINFLTVFSQIGMGLILTWMVLNYSILHAMFLHFLYNGIIMSTFVTTLHFVDTTPKTHTVDNYKITWNLESIFKSVNRQSISMYNQKELTNFPIHKLKGILNLSDSIQINPEYYHNTLNISIISLNDEEISNKTVEKLLVESGLFVKVKP